MESTNKIRVLIIDDSIVFRKKIEQELSKDEGIDVIGTARDALDAILKIDDLSPDVITVDIEMPRIDGFTFLQTLLPERPIPAIVVSAMSIKAVDALNVGAVDFIKKPETNTPDNMNHFYKELTDKIYVAAKARVRVPAKKFLGVAKVKNTSEKIKDEYFAKHGDNGLVRPDLPSLSTPATPQFLGSTKSTLEKRSPKIEVVDSKVKFVKNVAVDDREGNHPKLKMGVGKDLIIAIGASTGGTEAILEVVKYLPEYCPPVVITQHMPSGFTQMYARRLNSICPMDVSEAVDGFRLDFGTIVIAAGEHHLRVARDSKGYVVSSSTGAPVNRHCPSVDVLFSSVAACAGKNAIGVILTGMGADGARGLREMRDCGAHTIGQDRASSVVYGMPMEAFNIGAVERQLPLDKITDEIITILNKT